MVLTSIARTFYVSSWWCVRAISIVRKLKPARTKIFFYRKNISCLRFVFLRFCVLVVTFFYRLCCCPPYQFRGRGVIGTRLRCAALRCALSPGSRFARSFDFTRSFKQGRFMYVVVPGIVHESPHSRWVPSDVVASTPLPRAAVFFLI